MRHIKIKNQQLKKFDLNPKPMSFKKINIIMALEVFSHKETHGA
jgi:hypothetical protein